MRRKRLRQRVGVLGERNFRRFYLGYATSLLGSSMSTVAIAFAVLESGHSATGLGFVFTAAVVPQVLLLPVAGAIADRLGRRRVMLAADMLRCAAQATLATALVAGRPALWLFVLLAWLGGMGTAFFSPTLTALTVEIAPGDQLGNANAVYGLARSATRIIGPALGGVLVALAGSAVVVAVDAATYAVSVLALSLLRMPKTAAGPAVRRTLWGDMAEGWADFRSRTWLWVTTVQFAFFNLITWAPWMLLGPVMGRAYLGGAAVWGAIMAVQGAGAIAAGLLCLGRRPRRPMVIATVGTFCYALPDIPMALHAGGALGGRGRLRLWRGIGGVQHLLRHRLAAAGAAGDARPGQLTDVVPRLRHRRDRVRDRRAAGRRGRAVGGLRRGRRLRLAEQRGRAGAAVRPLRSLARPRRRACPRRGKRSPATAVSVFSLPRGGRRTRPAGPPR